MKQKVVHTRLSPELFDDLVARAKKHRTTVSGLVRNLCEDFLDISENFTDIATDKARKLLFGTKKKDRGELVGYQPIVLVKDTECAVTEKKMKKGEQAYLAFYENCPRGIIVCKEAIDTDKVGRKK